MNEIEKEELCPKCGYRVHPCLPCEEVIALNTEDTEEYLRGWTIPVLDHGYVRLIDWFGTDGRICEAAEYHTNRQVKVTTPTRNLFPTYGRINIPVRLSNAVLRLI